MDRTRAMDRAKAIDRARKMLNVARSIPGTPEGNTAHESAQRYIREYNITEEELQAAQEAADEADEARAEGREAGTPGPGGRDLDPWEDDLRTICEGAGGGTALFYKMHAGVIEEHDKECIRIRCYYLGRCGRRLDIAMHLEGLHMTRYRKVWLGGLLGGLAAHMHKTALPTAEALTMGIVKEVGVVETPPEALRYLVGFWEAPHPVEMMRWHVHEALHAARRLALAQGFAPTPAPSPLAGHLLGEHRLSLGEEAPSQLGTGDGAISHLNGPEKHLR